MALTEPDIFAPAVDTPSINALLTSIPTPPKGKSGETPSGAWPVPPVVDGSDKKEMRELKEERKALQSQLRLAMSTVGGPQLPQRTGPSLPQQIIAQSMGNRSNNSAPMPIEEPTVTPESGGGGMSKDPDVGDSLFPTSAPAEAIPTDEQAAASEKGPDLYDAY